MKRVALTITILLFFTIQIQGQDGLLLYREGRYSEAIDVCLQELTSPSRHLLQKLDSYAVLGWSLIPVGRYEEAERYGLEALALVPNDERIIEILGEATYYQERYEEAIDYFNLYLSTYQNGYRRDIVYYFLGEIYLAQKRYQHADMALSQSLAINQSVPWRWLAMGTVKEELGEFDKAIEAYREALDRNPSLTEASERVAELEASF